MKSMRDEEVELIYCLIDRVDNARALSPSDVGSLLYDISEGEYLSPLKWMCEAIDKHDSIPSQGELEALRDLGSRLDVDVGGPRGMSWGSPRVLMKLESEAVLFLTGEGR